MSLEQAIQENTAAVKELTLLIKAGGTIGGATDAGNEKTTEKATGGAKGKSTGKATGKAKVEVVDPDTLKAKLVEYKNATDMKAAKALTKELGYDAIADVPEDKSKEVYDAICAAIADLDNGNTADDNGEEDL
ncbi:hypothetical protein SOP91_00290 (plasmid) [Enterobacter hormaechei]|uniref:hypothetical protein n=1 Tax=Enterobacter hormaechei TaxID=158836 RepID=UPI002B4BBD54|nr:hypothetical protein [Enterobacter hormaechei]WRM07070.1 hypothetical protein SOP91_00290 [Enterobacter hormaechei]